MIIAVNGVVKAEQILFGAQIGMSPKGEASLLALTNMEVLL